MRHPLPDALAELLRLEGFLQAGVAHPLQEGLGRVGVRAPRDEHHPARLLGGGCLELRVQLHPRHLRHHQVTEDDVIDALRSDEHVQRFPRADH
ncbi:hypothetical protein STIAU_1641, partial [Stigmatella aurantiaca DW4/3-1]